MSGTTAVEWFSARPLVYPTYVEQLVQTIDLFGAQTLEHLSEEPWDRDEEASFASMFGLVKYPKQLGAKLPVAALRQYIRPQRGYELTLRGGVLSQQLFQASTDAIPLEISNHVAPCAPAMHVGLHNIENGDSDEDLGRAQVAICLWCGSTPHHLMKFQELWFQLDIVRRLEADITDIWGPLQRTMYTSS
jgi:hypothetical protein